MKHIQYMKRVTQIQLDVAYNDYEEVKELFESLKDLVKLLYLRCKIPEQPLTTEDVTEQYKQYGVVAFIDGTSARIEG